MVPELSDKSVVDLLSVVVNVWDNDVLSLTFSNNGFFLNVEVLGLVDGNLGKVKLESGGNTSLDVVCPFIDILVEDDSLSLSGFNLNLEGFSQSIKLGVSLEFVGSWVSHIKFSIVSSKKDIGDLNVEGVSGALDVDISGDVEDTAEADVVSGSGGGRE